MLNTAGIIVTILLLIFLIYILRNKVLDNFIVFLDDLVIPTTCYDYLVTNGKNFFLLNTNKILDGVTNPLTFNNKIDAINYLKASKCPDNIPFVDLVMRKKLDDPTVSLQRECSKKIAPNLFDIDVCGAYGSDYDTLTGKTLSKLNQIENEISKIGSQMKESRPTKPKTKNGTVSKKKVSKKKTSIKDCKEPDQDSPNSSIMQTVTESVLIGATMCYQNRAYLLFGITSIGIYFYGDYASV
jgi:hypothetical protein